MPLPLPNLDDRRWQDLTQEAVALIPRYAPQWTDFNTHDPGITLLELFAWLSESLIYRLNLVPDRFKCKFLSLICFRRRGPQPSHTVLMFQPIPAGVQLELPKGAQFQGIALSGTAAVFSTVRPIDLSPVTLSAVQGDAGSGTLRDYSRDFVDGLAIMALGVNPAPGAALYLGFQTIPSGVPVAIWFWFEGSGRDASERLRIIAEARAQKAACRVHEPGWPCNGKPAPQPNVTCDPDPGPIPPHHSARIVWEAFTGGTWTALRPVAMPAPPATGEVMDDTRSLTLNGLVEVNLPPAITQTVLGSVPDSLFYVRCRLAAGAYDAPMIVQAIQPNAVAAVQHGPLWQQLTIAGTVPPLASPPSPGQPISLQFTVAADLSIQSLAVQSPPAASQPSFVFVNYVAPLGGNAGSLTMEFAIAGIGTAVPLQQVFVPGAPVEDFCFQLYAHDGTSWTAWTRVTDFDAATRTDLAYTFDPTTGLVTCGDGERGQVFPQGDTIVATGVKTLGEQGNAKPRSISGVAANPVNQMLLASISSADQALLSQVAANPFAAAGGLPAAPLTEFEGQAAEVVHAHERILDLAQNAQQTTLDQIPKSAVLALPAPTQAVNLLDTERIALDVPGTVVERVRAWADTDPAFPGIHATGVVTVVILPDMPIAEPEPSAGLLSAVKRYLDRRRVITTRIETAAPTYVVITVTANVQAATGANTGAVQTAILSALQNFLDPLGGGPAGLGWPFGRSVFRAEILQLIANVAGVNHVNSMTMTADSGPPQCGDIILCPTFLVSSGAHQIQAVAS
jgi:hypothetical protein